MILVSVPSRGLSYLNTISEFSKIIAALVSVPSRGLSYLNIMWVSQERRYKESFRPLTGTLLSKRQNHWIFKSWQRSCFRPLTGTLLSKRIRLSSQRWKMIKVSVPSRGLSYLNVNKAVLNALGGKNVSVPSRGLSYLNTIRQFSLPKRLLPLVCVANDILMIKEFNVFI